MMDIWGKPITAGNATAEPERMRKAWVAWLEIPFNAREPWRLSALLRAVGTIPERCAIADQMIDRARRAGIIEYRSRSWMLTAGQREAVSAAGGPEAASAAVDGLPAAERQETAAEGAA